MTNDQLKAVIDGEVVPLKSVMALKAELAQALADNQRLREAMETIADIEIVLSPSVYRVKETAHKALSNPLPTGYGAAMLRVVEAGEEHSQAWDVLSDGQFLRVEKFDTLEDAQKLRLLTVNFKLWRAVQALKELESK